jgi:RNase P subunit RPR2
MTATAAKPIRCERCKLPFAEYLDGRAFRIAGVRVETRKYADLTCPTCGSVHHWQPTPAVQDVHHVIEKKGDGA